jgi:hypothetical protein
LDIPTLKKLISNTIIRVHSNVWHSFINKSFE